MGNKYLSSSEKTVVLTIASFISYLDDRIELWTKLKRPKNQVKYTKMAKSFTGKVLDFLMEDINEDQCAKLVGGTLPVFRRGPGGAVIKQMEKIEGELNKMQVVVKYKDEAVREYKRMEQMDSITHIETADLDTIVGFAMASCNLCELIGQECTDCDIKKLFIKYDIPPLNCNPFNGCPYRL